VRKITSFQKFFFLVEDEHIFVFNEYRSALCTENFVDVLSIIIVLTRGIVVVEKGVHVLHHALFDAFFTLNHLN
jgi:hypothetical protein